MVVHILRVSPPGWSGTTEAMKRHKDIDNPWALAWWMKKQGYKPHYPDTKRRKQRGAKIEKGFIFLGD